MGKFVYEGNLSVELEDRVLAHLQIVVSNKLRRSEPFFFTWRDDASMGGGRNAVWVHPHAGLTFKFYGSRVPAINRAWLDAMMYTANSTSGLYIVPEPPEDTPADPVI
jgi:hypothetical protein